MRFALRPVIAAYQVDLEQRSSSFQQRTPLESLRNTRPHEGVARKTDWQGRFSCQRYERDWLFAIDILHHDLANFVKWRCGQAIMALGFAQEIGYVVDIFRCSGGQRELPFGLHRNRI